MYFCCRWTLPYLTESKRKGVEKLFYLLDKEGMVDIKYREYNWALNNIVPPPQHLPDPRATSTSSATREIIAIPNYIHPHPDLQTRSTNRNAYRQALKSTTNILCNKFPTMQSISGQKHFEEENFKK